jgi:thioredoxin-dependent peroxiredoxin
MPSTAKKPTVTLDVGAKAPAFSLPVSEKEALTLAGLKGKKVVLYFYPKDDTPGCTIEAKDFRDRMKAFEKAGAVIIGVSKDPLKSHDKFREKYCLPFPLGSDAEGTVCEDYGVWAEKSMYGKTYMGIERATFLIDGNGVLQHIWRKVKVDGHAEEVLQAVSSL